MEAHHHKIITQMPHREMTAQKKRKMKIISSAIFFVAMTVLVVSLMLSLGDMESISEVYHNIAKGDDWTWLLVAFILALVYFFLWPIPSVIFGRTLDSEASDFETYLIGASEHFYNGVTPSASGGQPFQVYGLTSRNVPTAKATGIILMTYIIQLLVSNLYAFLSLIYYSRYLTALDSLNLSWMQWVLIIGLIFNFINLVICMMLGNSKHMAGFLVRVFTWLCRPKWINRHFGNKIPVFQEYCRATQEAIKLLNDHPWETVKAFLWRALAVFCYFAIPFFLLKAVGVSLDYSLFFPTFLGASFAINCLAWFPTPGGTGAIEYAFSIVIASVLGGTLALDKTNAISLLWRMVTFYFVLLLSFIASAIFEGLSAKRIKQEEKVLELEEEKASEAKEKAETEKKAEKPETAPAPAPIEKKETADDNKSSQA
jgi:uncharacterized protein (TIRG00374 family)